jgi:hypothetical protein
MATHTCEAYYYIQDYNVVEGINTAIAGDSLPGGLL